MPLPTYPPPGGGFVRPAPGSVAVVPGSGTSTVPAPPRNPAVPPPATPGAATVWTIALTAARTITRLNAMQQTPFLLESPWYAVEGESLTFTITYEGATTITSPSAKVYKDETDVTSTVMPSGSAAASGNQVTLPALTALIGGERYVIAITAIVDGATLIKKLAVLVAAPGAE